MEKYKRMRDREAATEKNNMQIMVIKCYRKLQEMVGGQYGT